MAPRPAATVIAALLPWPPATGGQKRTLRLLEAMDRAGVTPRLLTPDGSKPATEELRARGWGVEVAVYPPASLRGRLGQHARRRPSPYIADVERRLRTPHAAPSKFVQVEHTMSGYYFAAHPAVPSVLSTHNVDSEMLAMVARGRSPFTPAWAADWNRSLAMGTTERRVAKRADAVLCVSESDAEHFARYAREVLLVPNGVDDEVFAIDATPPKGEGVLFFGRLDYAPNDHGLRRFLAEAWPRIAAARPTAHLRVVGAGISPDAAAAVAAAPRAEAAGMVPDIGAELARCSVVSVPIWQGGGTRLKVLEALGAARPIAGTPLGVSGLGVRPGVHAAIAEDDAGLADATTALLGDPGARRAMAEAGRRLANGHRWEVATAPAVELYARWAARKPAH